VKKHPDQIGEFGSPASNSTQTVAPTRGKALPSFFEALFGGTQGIAKTEVPSKTSGTATWMRPKFRGSVVLITVARYFPKNLALIY
jgi:hypothetical protein